MHNRVLRYSMCFLAVFNVQGTLFPGRGDQGLGEGNFTTNFTTSWNQSVTLIAIHCPRRFEYGYSI